MKSAPGSFNRRQRRTSRGYEEPTHIANAPEYLKGVVNLRGVIVPIVDMRMRFGCEKVEYNSFTVSIILNLGHRVVGIVVDAVSDVMELAADVIRPAPEMSAAIDARYITGLGQVGERMLILLDIESLILGRPHVDGLPMKIGTKLWCATAIIATCQLGLVAVSGVRSASSTQFFETHQAAHEAKLQVFFEEAAENLDRMEQLLLELDIEAADDEELNAIFRCAHSIKGGAATFGFADVAELTHQMETLACLATLVSASCAVR